MTRVFHFFARHLILSTLLIWGGLIILSLMVHRPGWKYVKPLEKMLAERYGDDDLMIEHIWFDEDTQKVHSLDLVISKEWAESDDVMKVCYEIQNLIADYIKGNREYFSLNSNEEFSLYFYIGRKKGWLARGKYYLLKFTNENASYEMSHYSFYEYENDFVRCCVKDGESDESNKIEREIKLNEFSCFEKMQMLSFYCRIEMDDLQPILDLRQLKYVQFLKDGDKTKEIEKKWASLLEEKGIVLEIDEFPNETTGWLR